MSEQLTIKDYLKKNLNGQKVAGTLNQTRNLEIAGKYIAQILQGSNVEPEDITYVKKFIVDVEHWKSMGRAQYSVFNEKNFVFNTLKRAYNAETYTKALSELMLLKGFKEKTASAILRFLKPVEFGVVDWRNNAVVHLMEKYNNDINLVIANGCKIRDAKTLFDLVDVNRAFQLQKYYQKLRNEEVKRAADIDMALFAISLEIWRMNF